MSPPKQNNTGIAHVQERENRLTTGIRNRDDMTLLKRVLVTVKRVKCESPADNDSSLELESRGLIKEVGE